MEKLRWGLLHVCFLLSLLVLTAPESGCGSSGSCNSGQLHSQLEIDLQQAATGGVCGSTSSQSCVTALNAIVNDYTSYCKCINSPNNPPNESEVALIVFNIQAGIETSAQEATC